MRALSILSAGLVLFLTACPSPEPPAATDAGATDAGVVDAGLPDAGTPDAGVCFATARQCDGETVQVCTDGAWVDLAACPDGTMCVAGACEAVTVDAGVPDAGEPDAGTVDAGEPDAGIVDAGTADAGEPDAGTVDAGEPDAGMVDAGTVDAGVCMSTDRQCDGATVQVCTDGAWVDLADCPAGTMCTDGQCAMVCTPQCTGKTCGDDGCGGSCGTCGAGESCSADGQCEAICTPDCTGKTCGDDGCGGSCGACVAGEMCSATGQCEAICTPDCTGKTCGGDGCGGSCGACAMDETCSTDGQCEAINPCQCAADEVCVDLVCQPASDLCSAQNPTGLCEAGAYCLEGQCVDGGAACSAANPTGTCPVGEQCMSGACVALDGPSICDDGNPCTDDDYDAVLRTCVNTPAMAMCSDGDACTTNQCVAGMCTATPIAGCSAGPIVDPVVSPTNAPDLVLSGQKPAGASITIGGTTAVSADPETTWSVTVPLTPGENVLDVRSVSGGTPSAARTVTVVYDPDGPVVTATPGGGVFVDGVTMTASADEPAMVYFTTDGSEPTAHSRVFRSAKTFRVFDAVTYRFRALDDAGNWQTGTTDVQFEISAEPTAWHTRDALPAARSLAAATLLGEDVVLIAGSDGSAPLSTAVRQGADGMWADLPDLGIPRTGAAAVTVGSTVYTLGGESNGIMLNHVQSWSDGDMAWTNEVALLTTRTHLAAAVVDGRIFTFGGETNGGTVLDVVESWRPGDVGWSNTHVVMPRGRTGARAAVVAGEIYVLGGRDGTGAPIAEVDVYSPGHNTWRQVAAMPTPRAFTQVGVVQNRGQLTGGTTGIVVAGGIALGAPSALVEEFVVDTGEWRTRRALDAAVHSGAAVVKNGSEGKDNTEAELWVLGGSVAAGPSADVHAFVRLQDGFRAAADMPEGRFAASAVGLDDSIYVLGGRGFQPADTLWRFNPEAGAYTALAPLPSALSGIAAGAADGQIWAFGGENAFGLATPAAAVYDPAADMWSALAPMLTGRSQAAVVQKDGEFWLIGGDNNGALQSVDIYDPMLDTWRSGPALPLGRTGALAFNHEGKIVVVGGRDMSGDAMTSIWAYEGGAWQTLPGALSAADATGVLLGGRITVFTGREDAGPVRRVSAYDVDAETDVRVSGALLDRTDHQAIATAGGSIYLFGGTDTEAVGPDGLATVQRVRQSCLNGILDFGESADGLAQYGAGCGNARPGAVSSGGTFTYSDGYTLNTADLTVPSMTHIEDGGGDAFDNYGYTRLTVGGASVSNINIAFGDRVVNVGAGQVRVRSDKPFKNVVRLRFDAANAAAQTASITVTGDMGSDNATSHTVVNRSRFGATYRAFRTDDGSGGDPGVLHVMVPSDPNHLGRVSYGRVGDDITTRSGTINLPAVFYVAVGHTVTANPNHVLDAILSDLELIQEDDL